MHDAAPTQLGRGADWLGRWLRDIPIRRKLVLAFVVPVGFIALSVYLFVPRQIERIALDAVATRAASIGEMTAYSAAAGLYFEDDAAIEEAFEVARQNKDLRYLVATDPEGYVVTAFGESTARHARYEHAGTEGPISADGLTYRTVTPALIDGREVGQLYLGLSLQPLRTDIQQTRTLVAGLSVLLFVLAMGVVAGISTAITRPLSRITRTTEEIADGDLARRAPVHAYDEVGYLALAFNRMVDRLEEAYTDLRAMNAHLQQQDTALRHEIAERERYEIELVEAKERAEEMARLKSAFLTNMSHEIRTPLTGILGFADILAQETEGEHAEIADLIALSGRRLLDTLNSVLDLAKLESGSLRLTLERLDVGAEVAHTAQLLAPMAEERGLALQITTTAAEADLDRSCLDRVVTNLVGNAIKFTNEGGVTVCVDTTEAHVRLIVRDTGIGINEAFLPKLFDEFQQESDGLDRSHEGSGLGLAITKRLVEAMGGTIRVTSQRAVGSTFTVEFPRRGRSARHGGEVGALRAPAEATL